MQYHDHESEEEKEGDTAHATPKISSLGPIPRDSDTRPRVATGAYVSLPRVPHCHRLAQSERS